VENVPDTMRIILFPNKITAKYQIFIEDIPKQDIIPVEFIANLKTITNNKIKIKAIFLNKHILNLFFSPKEVDYIIEKK